MAEKVEAETTVIVGLESQVRREVVGTIGLAWLVSERRTEDGQVPYLLEEGRCDFQEVRREELQNQINFQCLHIFISLCTYEDSIPRVLESRSLVVVGKPSRRMSMRSARQQT